jgi:Transposase DDE domain
MTSFVDPAPNIPIDAAQFISLLNLSPIAATLKRFYIEPYKIRHPPEAFLRLLALQKLKRYKFLTELYRELDDQTIKLLGFKYKPSYKTLWHWLNKRVGPDGLETIHTEIMKIINQTLAAQGIQIGKIVCADATHIAAQSSDKEAAYNGHYKTKCYLLHHLICAVTGLTVNWIVAPGNVDEGQFLVPMLAKTLADGFRPELLTIDNGYAHYFNYEIPNFLGIKLLIGFRGKNKFSWRGKPKTLKLRYRKVINAGKLTVQKLAELNMQADVEKNRLEDIVCALAVAGQHEYVGAYFRNQSLSWFRRDRRGWLSLYAAPRSVIEGTHGHQKDWLDLDGLVERGLRKVRVHAALCMLCEASVALVRVQYGCVESLTSQAYIR